ncbi:DoxX family protein [Nocardia inohanensis]|uniref:DoxX family protein n=1 Tax=Nocardia inohanensis TaxID=209246 RepID=UPI000830B33F|nr:DoxX family protein [Nocardia inohanensis]
MTTELRAETRTIVYWLTTVIIATESAVGGVWDILRIDYVRDVIVDQLEYPTYVAVILGIAKLPGAAVLLVPKFPRLKEWVYAGVFFIYTGASISLAAQGDYAAAIGPLGFAAITGVSWASRPESRRRVTFAPRLDGNRPAAYGFWTATSIVVFVLLTGGVADVIQRGETAGGMVELGYPTYFMYLLGGWKILGALTIAVPGYPRLKEWAYAGAFYDFGGAFASHLAFGSAVNHKLWTASFAVCVLISWGLRASGRTLTPPVTPLARSAHRSGSPLPHTARR